MLKFKKEKYYGNIEYKLKLNNLSELKKEKYISQMRFRLIEGNGKAIYIIGIKDNGEIIGIDVLKKYKTIKILNLIVKKNKGKIKNILECFLKKKLFLIFEIESELFRNKGYFLF